MLSCFVCDLDSFVVAFMGFIVKWECTVKVYCCVIFLVLFLFDGLWFSKMEAHAQQSIESLDLSVLNRAVKVEHKSSSSSLSFLVLLCTVEF